LDLFTPETWAAFREHGAAVSGYRERQRRTADQVKSGDLFLCYLVRLSRWCGALEVTSGVYVDQTPIFANPDPFVLRFKVNPKVVLSPEHSIPMLDNEIWAKLSLTRNLERGVFGWAQAANLRASLREINAADGNFLLEVLTNQAKAQKIYELTTKDQRNLRRVQPVRVIDRSVLVEIPEQDEDEDITPQAPSPTSNQPETRESYRVQAALAQIGADMGYRIWIPRSDRAAVASLMRSKEALLDVLPLNYDDATLRTIEQIDVIWLKIRSMARAFEVEHTTAIYSGLLRMADLLALQPNMDIRLHIVAPVPLFSLLDRGPLYESCTFIPYSSVNELSSMKHLEHRSI
jgi:hypothetical protein